MGGGGYGPPEVSVTDNARDGRDAHARWIGAALERFESPLTLYATRLVGDVHRGRDVVQEAFLRLCREDRSLLRHVAPWLYRVTRNLAMDWRRREPHMERTNAAAIEERRSPLAGPEAAAEAGDESAKALRALDALPEAQQEVVRLKFRHGLSYREIAEVTGLTVSHVGVLIHEGVKTLRGKLLPRATIETTNGGAR